jgi:mRNA-degrading endonuclease RelE of RelBE toxin-antitoxin system
MTWDVSFHDDFITEFKSLPKKVRVAIAARAILLVAGDKSGVKERRFYKTLIAKAEERFDQHLKQLGKGTNHVNTIKGGPQGAHRRRA